jgi:Uma2 family endonuclease
VRHERIVARLIGRLEAFVRQHKDVQQRTVRPSQRKSADRASRRGKLDSIGDTVFPQLVPDLPSSPPVTPRQVLDKAVNTQAGVRLVWVIDPEQRQAAVHRSLTDVRHIEAAEALDGDTVVPGFRCTLSEVLD